MGGGGATAGTEQSELYGFADQTAYRIGLDATTANFTPIADLSGSALDEVGGAATLLSDFSYVTPTLPIDGSVWTATGLDTSNNSFSGTLTIDSVTPVKNGFSVSGAFDWLANGSIDFVVNFDGLVGYDLSFKTTATSLAQQTAGVIAADYTGQFSSDLSSISGAWSLALLHKSVEGIHVVNPAW